MRQLRMVTVLTLVGLVLASCGGTGTSSTQPDATTTPTPAAGASDTTQPPTTTTPPPPPTTTPAPTGAGTRSDPIPAGDTARVGNYDVTVVSWNQDGTQDVLDENMFNEDPPEGAVFSLIRLGVVYQGDETGNPFWDLRWSGVGDSNVASESDCGVMPDSMSDAPELFPGGNYEANICLVVKTSELASLVLILEETFSFTNDSRLFFALP